MATMEEVTTIQERCMVVPETPTPRHDLFLSSLDLFSLPLGYVRMLFFYDTEEQDAFITTLRESLACVLVPFYPVAGRLAPCASTGEDGRVCIDCNDEGVEFTIAAAENADFLELQAYNFPPCPFFDSLVPVYAVQNSSDAFRWPLASVQVTKFKSGRGVVVGCAQSHVVADGESWCHFFLSWAECARKVPISVPPLHTRTLLAVRTPSPEIALAPYIPPDEVPITHCHSVVCTYIPCSSEVIKNLKQEANASYHHQRSEMMQFSSYEAMGAFWWKQVTRARGLEEDDQVVTFIVIRNMRRRLRSAAAPHDHLPTAYFGNAAIPVIPAFAKAGELLKESLASTAARIHQASQACTEDFMWATLHWLGPAFDPKLYTRAPRVELDNSPHFPFDTVDYGYGRPDAIAPAKMEGVDGHVMLFPPRDGIKGGVDCFLSLTPQGTQHLLEDELLGSLLLVTSKSKSIIS